jgi:Tfp pilus assembly protein PilF
MLDSYKLDELFLEADELLKQNRVVEAQKILEEIIVEDASFVKAYNHLGWLYETKFRNLEKAEQNYRMALTFDPKFDSVYYNYAVVLSTQKRWKELEELLSEALKISHINLSTIYNEFGIMWELQGQYDKAISFYKDAAKNSLDAKNIALYKDSVLRCKQKQEIDNI